MLDLKVIQLHKNEKRLLKKALEHNRDAQRELFELYAPKMLSICRQYIRDIHFAEDVMITGFAKVFKYLENYRGEGSFEGWIRKIMVRESISFLRSQKKVEFYTETLPSVKSEHSFTDMDLDVNDIQQLIDELPEGYRMVFLMFAVEGYKHREIAEMFEISENTSKSQLSKARKLLQQKIRQINTRDNGTS